MRRSLTTASPLHSTDFLIGTSTLSAIWPPRHHRQPEIHVFHRRSSRLIAANYRADLPTVQYCSLDDWNTEVCGSDTHQRAVVALGKFDAMHKGHRALAAEAAAAEEHPWLVSFSGMAEVLGWPSRPPLVADCDRARVLASWAPFCGGQAPCQRFIPFAAVRLMSPEDFVRVLAIDLKVAGVVVGKGFRFGYKASGDTQSLLSLGQHYGLGVSVVDLVAETGKLKVSSSAVRSALADGNIDLVSKLLDRRHRLVVQTSGEQRAGDASARLVLPRTTFRNQSPQEGMYEVDVSLQLSDGNNVTIGKLTALLTVEGLELQRVPERTQIDAGTRVYIDF